MHSWSFPGAATDTFLTICDAYCFPSCGYLHLALVPLIGNLYSCHILSFLVLELYPILLAWARARGPDDCLRDLHPGRALIGIGRHINGCPGERL